MYEIIDSHAHIDELENISDVVAEARRHNVTGIVAVGTSFLSNQKILKLAKEFNNYIYPALGLFPWNIADDDFEINMEFIRDNIKNAIGMGEIGLDYSKGVKERASKETQKNVFRELLEIAGANNKPALIHSRYSWQDCLNLTIEAHIEKAVFHWYTGPLDILDKIIDKGYYISASPAAEYHEEHRRAIMSTPIERLLLETDSPVTYRRGTELEYESRPSDALRALSAVSEIKNMDKEAVAEITARNTRHFFQIC
jgi:TatD DNase family protein